MITAKVRIRLLAVAIATTVFTVIFFTIIRFVPQADLGHVFMFSGIASGIFCFAVGETVIWLFERKERRHGNQ